MINKVHLDRRANDFFAERLRSGSALANLVLGMDNIPRQLYTLVPQGINEVELYDFWSGGKLDEGSTTSDSGNARLIPNTDSVLSSILETSLRSDVHLVGVLEDALARRRDLHLAEGSDHILYGDDVYHVVPPALSAEEICSRLGAAKSIPQFVGFVTEWPLKLRGTKLPTDVDISELKAMALKTRLAFVSVYDGESYLIGELNENV